MSHFLAKFRFPVTQDLTLLKTFTITKLSVRETKLSSPERPRQLSKESVACLTTKASNSSHFHFPLIFCSLLSQPVSHLRNLKKNTFSAESLYHKDSNMFRRFNKVKPKAILRTSELPSLCNVVSSIYQFFVPHFAMAVFICNLSTLSYV